MKLITSKLSRIINNSMTLPTKCNFINYVPQSLDEICDCKYECKFPGKGGPPRLALNYNYYSNNNEILVNNLYSKK